MRLIWVDSMIMRKLSIQIPNRIVSDNQVQTSMTPILRIENSICYVLILFY